MCRGGTLLSEYSSFASWMIVIGVEAPGGIEPTLFETVGASSRSLERG